MGDPAQVHPRFDVASHFVETLLHEQESTRLPGLRHKIQTTSIRCRAMQCVPIINDRNFRSQRLRRS